MCLVDFDEDEEEAGVLLEYGQHVVGPCVDMWVRKCCGNGLQATCSMCSTDIKY
jgi:hypothetical protein